LLDCGFDVVIAGRTPASVEAAANRIRESKPAACGRVATVSGDLARLDAVEQLARDVLSAGPRLNLLVNNAGANFPRQVFTAEGVEQTLAIDTLAPLHLATMLMPALEAAGGTIVNVASGLLRQPDPGRWTGPQPYSQMSAYSQAKALLIVLTRELAARNPGVVAISMTPGMVRTGLDRNASGPLKLFLTLVKMISATPDDAADALARLATSPTLVSGAFYRKGRMDEPAAIADCDASAAWSSAMGILAGRQL
jgi:NAD(P)-dependent dehydrogenase (short-subunit alcohol dehydrogenase family)